MFTLEQLTELAQTSPLKIVLFVMDGLGGLPHPRTRRSELETARKPNLDALARDSSLGLIEPVAAGITPGSGPGHLALFGYDPVRFLIKRGIIEALGIDLEVRAGDVVARGNFCLVDDTGRIVDRRAGRLPTEINAVFCQKMNEAIKVPGVEISFFPVQDYRFVLRLRGKGLNDELTESDPGRVGDLPRQVEALSPKAAKTAEIVNRIVEQVPRALEGQARTNMVLLRGFSQPPDLPSISGLYKVNAAAIAIYPMYRGLAQAVGMTVYPPAHSFAEEVEVVAQHWDQHDFFYLHYKTTDSAGEDGDFDGKVAAIEEVDAVLGRLLYLKPDVLAITGDHASPAVLKAHSWHPVPFLLSSPYTFPDHLPFTERTCAQGSLGRFPAVQVMSLLLAHALKLARYGA
jgi:2,3-bisphosphoglycerate-independent phosphoglycerate mutase